MAWAVDQATLGTNASTGSSTTIVLTTTNAVTAGGHIFVVVGWFHASVTLSSVAGGSLTWSTVAVNNGGVRAALASAPAPSGLASATAITATFSGSTGERKIGGASFTGGTGTRSATTTNTGSGTDWSISPTLSGNHLAIAAASLDTNGTSSPDANSTELLDFVVGTASRSFLYYRIGGSTVGGTFSASAAWSAAAGTFEVSGGGESQQIDPAVIASGSQLFAPSLSSTVTVSPGAISSGESVPAPLLTPGAVTVSPALIASGSQVFDASIGAVTLLPEHVASTAEVFAPTLNQTVTPDAIAAGSQTFDPTISPGAVTVSPALLGPNTNLHTPDIQGGDVQPAVAQPIPVIPTIPEIPSRD